MEKTKLFKLYEVISLLMILPTLVAKQKKAKENKSEMRIIGIINESKNIQYLLMCG